MEETGPRWDRITEQAFLGKAWSWLLEKDLTDSWRPSRRTSRNSCGIRHPEREQGEGTSGREGNRRRELCVLVMSLRSPVGSFWVREPWRAAAGLGLLLPWGWSYLLGADGECPLARQAAQVVKYILLWAIFKAMGLVRICVKVGLEAPVKKWNTPRPSPATTRERPRNQDDEGGRRKQWAETCC